MNIAEYIKKRRLLKQQKEIEERNRIRTEAELARKEYSELKKLEKDRKDIRKLQELKQKIKPTSKLTNFVTSINEGMTNFGSEINKVNKKMGFEKVQKRNADFSLFQDLLVSDSTRTKIEKKAKNKRNDIFGGGII